MNYPAFSSVTANCTEVEDDLKSERADNKQLVQISAGLASALVTHQSWNLCHDYTIQPLCSTRQATGPYPNKFHFLVLDSPRFSSSYVFFVPLATMFETPFRALGRQNISCIVTRSVNTYR